MKFFFKFLSITLSVLTLTSCKNAEEERPNVILVMTDDQGYGDFSKFGNPVLKTPNLDRLHDESIRFTDFHVAPVCTPTRSQLLTGFDAMHNGAFNAHGQHHLLSREYTTMGDIFSQNGYNTALYGKWHLGGNFPGYRPHERGFQDAVYFLRGGHWSHPNYWNSDMMDDYYYHNGTLEKYEGYATDLWFQLGETFVKNSKREGKPFFLYLPLNAPHIPLLVPEKNRTSYLETGLDRESITFFAMVDAVDKNAGAFIEMLKREDLWRNTIFIFLTDNGSALYKQEYNAGMRGKKASEYDGGHRVPLFISWPDGDLMDPGDIDVLTQVQDLLPTLIDLCNLKLTGEINFNGQSLKSILKGGELKQLEERILVAQFRDSKNKGAVMWNKWRLVNGNELYNMEDDLHQEQNVADQYPEVVSKLTDHYNRWWEQSEKSIDDPAPYFIGSGNDEYKLTAYDWYWGKRVFNWPHLRAGDKGNGKYRIVIEEPGSYTISLRRWPKEAEAGIRASVPAFTPFDPYLGDLVEGKALDIIQARVKLGDQTATVPVDKDAMSVTFTFEVEKGETFLQTWFIDSSGDEFGAYYVYINKLQDGAAASIAPGERLKWEHSSSDQGDLATPDVAEQAALILLDIDKDGKDEIVVGGWGDTSVVWYRKIEDNWERYLLDNSNSPCIGGAYFDMDGDGDQDILFGGAWQSNEIWWWENPYPHYDPQKPWKKYTIRSTGEKGYHNQIFGDFDGDRKTELVCWNRRSGNLFIAEIPENPKNPDSWKFIAIWSWDGQLNYEGLAKGDINQDGKEDIVGGGYWFEHKVDQTYEARKIDDYGESNSAVGDLIKGGSLEVVLASADGVGPLNIYQWETDGWEKTMLINEVIHGHSIQVIDVDGDGNLDIFCAEMAEWAGETNPGSKTWLLFGDGKGSFTTEVLRAARDIGNHESKLGDVDGDGRPDIIQKPFMKDVPRLDIWLNQGINL